MKFGSVNTKGLIVQFLNLRNKKSTWCKLKRRLTQFNPHLVMVHWKGIYYAKGLFELTTSGPQQPSLPLSQTSPYNLNDANLDDKKYTLILFWLWREKWDGTMIRKLKCRCWNGLQWLILIYAMWTGFFFIRICERD